jgi:hypothetical protein
MVRCGFIQENAKRGTVITDSHRFWEVRMDLLVRRRTLGDRRAPLVFVVLGVAGVVVITAVRQCRVRRGMGWPASRAGGRGPAARPGHASADPSVLQVLSGELLRQRIAEGHARGYVNLVGMLQSVALGWVLVVLHQPAPRAVGSGQNVLVAAQAIVEVAAIIIIYHQYRTLTVLLCWVEDIFDTIIPFIIFSAEIWLGFNIRRGASWWFALALLCFAGGMALLHTLGRMTRGMFGDNHAGYRRYRRMLKSQMALCAIMAVAAGATAVILSWYPPPAFIDIALMTLFFAGGVRIALHDERDQRQLFAEYGTKRGGWSFRASAAGPAAHRRAVPRTLRHSGEPVPEDRPLGRVSRC